MESILTSPATDFIALNRKHLIKVFHLGETGRIETDVGSTINETIPITEPFCAPVYLFLFVGLFDVDVAEIIKPALILHIVGIADDLAIEDINVLDSAPPQGPSDGEHLEIMSKVSPERFKNKYIDSMSDNKTEAEMIPEEESMMMENELPMSEGFISRPMEEV